MKKYIILGNTSEWCYYSWKNTIEKDKSISFYNDKVPITGSNIIQRISQLHYSMKYNTKERKIPYKSIWNNHIINYLNIDTNHEYYIIVYDWNRLTQNLDFFDTLKRIYPNIKLIYLFSNIVKITGAIYYGILDRLKDTFDLVFAFDKLDANKYSFSYFPLIYTALDEFTNRNIIKYDLFYIGQAKDRLSQILELYEKATAEGLKCNFHIVGVQNKAMKYSNDIIYNQPMSYKDVLSHINCSRCLVDIKQSESTGLTIKVCESILYNKKLITTNDYIQKESFYSPENISIYDPNKKIKDFIFSDLSKYSSEDKNTFSPYNLFHTIDILLK